MLERPSEKMSQHLKPLYIKIHVDGLPIDRVLIDGGLAINVTPQIMPRDPSKEHMRVDPRRVECLGVYKNSNQNKGNFACWAEGVQGLIYNVLHCQDFGHV